MKLVGVLEDRHEARYDVLPPRPPIRGWKRMYYWLFYWNRLARLARDLREWLYPPVCGDCRYDEHRECDRDLYPCRCRRKGHR